MLRAPPDVIQSTLDTNNPSDHQQVKINTNTIDNLFGVPDKIVIPERYVPDLVRLNIFILQYNATDLSAKMLQSWNNDFVI